MASSYAAEAQTGKNSAELYGVMVLKIMFSLVYNNDIMNHCVLFPQDELKEWVVFKIMGYFLFTVLRTQWG